jgi:heme/copper-type cytochrome/quinol oxidase subunit 2
MLRSRPRLSGVLPASIAFVAVAAAAAVIADQGRREFDVVARKYAYRISGANGPEIAVAQNDRVHITFSTEDIPHSFTIEDTPASHYRIMKRAEPGKPVSFDFRADTAGRFRFYCSLTIDDGCKAMQGVLSVKSESETRARRRQPPGVAGMLLRRPTDRPSVGD